MFFFLFHTFSHQVSPTMRRQYLVQFRLFAGGPCWRDSTFLMYSVQISLWHFSRWHFYPWTVCFSGLLLPSESNFSLSMHYALPASVWPTHVFRLLVYVYSLRQRTAARHQVCSWKFTNFSRFSFGKVINNTIKIQSIGKFRLYGEYCQVCKPCLAHCWSKVVVYELLGP